MTACMQIQTLDASAKQLVTHPNKMQITPRLHDRLDHDKRNVCLQPSHSYDVARSTSQTKQLKLQMTTGKHRFLQIHSNINDPNDNL